MEVDFSDIIKSTICSKGTVCYIKGSSNTGLHCPYCKKKNINFYAHYNGELMCIDCVESELPGDFWYVANDKYPNSSNLANVFCDTCEKNCTNEPIYSINKQVDCCLYCYNASKEHDIPFSQINSQMTIDWEKKHGISASKGIVKKIPSDIK